MNRLRLWWGGVTLAYALARWGGGGRLSAAWFVVAFPVELALIRHLPRRSRIRRWLVNPRRW